MKALKCHFIRMLPQNGENCMDTQAKRFDFTLMQYKWTMCVYLALRKVFVVTTSRKTRTFAWLCSLFATTQYLKLVLHCKFIIFLFHLWEITVHDAFLYLLAQTPSRMYVYLNPCSLSLFLEYKAFQAPKFNCQFFCISDVLVCLL